MLRLLFYIFFLSLPAYGKEEIIASFDLQTDDQAMLNAVAKDFEIISRKGDTYRIYVIKEKIQKFKALAPKATLVSNDINAHLKALAKSNALEGYHSFQDVESYLQQMATRYPAIAKLETYGTSARGYKLSALRISDHVGEDEAGEVKVLLTSATHGDELMTVEVLLGLMDKMIKGYGNDPRLTAIVDKMVIYFVPVVCPDGFTIRSRYSNGVDPNREYPWPENPSRSPESSIKQIMSFYQMHNFAGSIDFHSKPNVGMIMFPWAYTYNQPISADNAMFTELTHSMSETNQYVSGQISRVIYVAKGSSADYYYWKNGGKALGYEIGVDFLPPASRIPYYVNKNTEATWRFLESF